MRAFLGLQVVNEKGYCTDGQLSQLARVSNPFTIDAILKSPVNDTQRPYTKIFSLKIPGRTFAISDFGRLVFISLLHFNSKYDASLFKRKKGRFRNGASV